MTHKVLSFDLGGTKVAVGIVHSTGKILEEKRVPVAFQQGKQEVLKQLFELGRSFLKNRTDIDRIGIASAGPLDPQKGILLEPTNFSAPGGEPWGKVPLSSLMQKSLKRHVYLENDAAAAVLAEHWVGSGKGYSNVMVLTLGTGLGTGIIINGQLLRAGRGLHPEAGHTIIGMGDTTAPCGCGNFGCAEAYLSGRNFEQRAQKILGPEDIKSKEIADLARTGNTKALRLFEDYAEHMSIAIQNYARLFAPEVIIFAGSFAAASDLFLKKTRMLLKQRLAQQSKVMNLVPKLTVSKLKNASGLIGGAYVALHAPRQTST